MPLRDRQPRLRHDGRGAWRRHRHRAPRPPRRARDPQPSQHARCRCRGSPRGTPHLQGDRRQGSGHTHGLGAVSQRVGGTRGRDESQVEGSAGATGEQAVCRPNRQSGEAYHEAGEGLQGGTRRICGAGEAKRGGDGRHEGQSEMDGHQIKRAEAQDHLAQRGVWLSLGSGGLSSCEIDFEFLLYHIYFNVIVGLY